MDNKIYKRLVTGLTTAALLFQPMFVKAEPAEETAVPVSTGISISEIMLDNKTVVRCEDGVYRDWIELHNDSGSTIDLKDYRLGDGDHFWSFPECTLEADEYKLVFFSEKNEEDPPEGTFQTGFHVSPDETVSLYDPHMNEIANISFEKSADNVSLALNESGSYEICYYPTPGRENTLDSYIALQEELAPAGPIIINEAATWNNTEYHQRKLDEYADWVELKNISSEPVSLSSYYLTDKSKDMVRYQLPNTVLNPGEVKVILCTDKFDDLYGYDFAPFGLDSGNESLFLTDGSNILDCISLKQIPYQGSFGRVDGSNGFFYFSSPTPEKQNIEGFRYICDMPETTTRAGQYNDVEKVTVDLSAKGDIYYTLDGSLPTRESAQYTGPIDITSTTIVRAICSDGEGLDSRPVTLNYIINEGITTPIVCLVADDPKQLRFLYDHAIDDTEIYGNISYYNGDESFSQDCGLKMSGNATLHSCYKRNLTARFRGCYGNKFLEYKLFDGSVDRYNALVLRGGHDYNLAIIRNELFENLCYKGTDNMITQRSEYCTMYLNGEYFGIYSLIEKLTTQFIADYAGVPKDSIELFNGPVQTRCDLQQYVTAPILQGKISDPEVYHEVGEHIDLDSLIDWYVFRGHSGDIDIVFNNVRFWRSADPSSDGKWRMLYFDLDAALRHQDAVFYNIARMSSNENQYAQMFMRLVSNEEFKDTFLTRLNEVLHGPLSDQTVLDEINALYDSIDAEIPRNLERWEILPYKHQIERDELYGFVETGVLSNLCINRISQYLNLTADELAHYFPDYVN